MKRIIDEIFDWLTAIDEAIVITAKDEAHSDHKGDEPQIHTCPADCKGAPGANWHSIETVGDLPEYSGKFFSLISFHIDSTLLLRPSSLAFETCKTRKVSSTNSAK